MAIYESALGRFKALLSRDSRQFAISYIFQIVINIV